jgi:hypothetical protein
MPDFPIKLGHRSSGAETIRAMQKNQIPWAFRPRMLYRQAVTLADFSPTAGLSQTLTLNTLFPRNTFPTTINGGVDLLEGCTVENLTLPAGGTITALTIEVGGTFDAGVDPSGLLTSSNLLGGGAAEGDVLNTPAAANYANRYESAFSPTVTLTAVGGNLNTLTALGFEVLIPWTPRAERSS